MSEIVRWEYLTETIRSADVDTQLRRIGANGWELVCVHPQFTHLWIFKRPMPPSPRVGIADGRPRLKASA